MIFDVLFLFYLAVQGLFTQAPGQNPAPPSGPTLMEGIAEKADINTGH